MSGTATERTGGTASPATYLLVHPERYPTNDWEVIGPHVPDGTALAGFDASYAAQVRERASSCSRRVVLLDDCGLEDVEDYGEILDGVPVGDWEIVPCGPEQVGLFREEERAVLIGGFARHDCVARAVKALKKLGLEATLDEPTTLPLSPQGAGVYFEI